MVRKRARMWGIVVGLGLLSTASITWADRIVLKGGGELQGALLPHAEDAQEVQVQLLRSDTCLTLPRDRIDRVVEVEDALDGYFERRAQAAETAEDRYELGLWCEQHGLPELATRHYKESVERDGSFVPAHEKLGHSLYDGQWLTHDEKQARQGLVRHGGQWIAPEEHALIAQKQQLRETQRGWYRQVSLLKQQLDTGKTESRERARDLLSAIEDPAALPALVEVLGQGQEAHRMILVELLAAFPGNESTAALVFVAIRDMSEPIRSAALNGLAMRDEQAVIGLMQAALGDGDPVVVGRAARALAALGSKRSVPRLVQVLVRVEQRQVMVPSMGRAVGPGATQPSLFSGIGQAYVSNVQPVVGPGVVAYQPQISTIGSGVAMGGGGSVPVAGPALPRLVRIQVPNPEVLAALESLTGRNFGYDLATWKRWLGTSFRVEDEPVRRVPQP